MSIVNLSKISFGGIESKKYDEVSYYLQPRIEELIDHYQSIFLGKKFYYSIVDDNFKALELDHDDRKRIEVNILVSDICYVPPAQFSEQLKSVMARKSLRNSIVIILDIFGRIRHIASNIDSLKDWRQAFYGDASYKKLLHMSASASTSFSDILLPFGNRVVRNDFLTTDQFGFKMVRRRKADRHLENFFRIIVLGGSFSYSIYSLPEECFSFCLQEELRRRCPNKSLEILNYSQPGLIQSDSMNCLLHYGLLKGIDAVLWIDGVNDIFTSHSSRSIGMDGDAAFNFPAKFNVKRFAFAGAAGASDEVEIANNYVRQRKYYVDILTSLGIRSVNILQPSFSKKVDYRSSCLEELFISTRKKGYDQLIPYLKAIGDDHGVKFEHLEQGTPELTFWDHFHLSPASEQIFAKAISSSVVKIIP